MTYKVFYVYIGHFKFGGITKAFFTFVFSLMFYTSLAHAEVIFSKTIKVQPNFIENLELYLNIAMSRPAEQMNYPAPFVKSGFVLWCDPHFPLTDGTGCSISIVFQKIGGENITIKKKANFLGMAQIVQDKLSSIDPETTEDHIHFGSIFTKESSEGSHFFCYANESKDGWDCELYVNEVIRV